MARKTQTRGKGEGSTYKNSRGQWVAEVEVDGRRIRGYGRDRTAARAALSLAVRAHESGTLSRDRRVTVEVAVRRFLDRAVPSRSGGTLAPSTRSVHQWAGELIVAGLGRRRLDKLTVAQVEDFLASLSVQRPPARNGSESRRRVLTGQTLSRASLVKVRNTLSLALDEAVRRGEVHGNVAKIAHLPADAPSTVARRSLSRAEAQRLHDHLRNEPLGALYALCLTAGLRPGEAAALHWSSIVGDTVTVSRGVRLTNGRPEVVEVLKTAASYRTVRVEPYVVDLLAEHRRRQVEQRLQAAVWVDPDLVFTTGSGTVLAPKYLRKNLAEVCARAGVEVVRPNELRHSCASYLSDQGVRHEQIADLLGHTTTRMVDRTYRHRLRTTVDVAAEVDWGASEAR